MKALALVLLLVFSKAVVAQEHTRVYIVETGDHNFPGDHHATITKAVLHACPELTLTDERGKSDYKIRIDHSDANLVWMGFTLNKPWMYFVYAANGDLLANGPARSLSAAAKQGCKVILAASR